MFKRSKGYLLLTLLVLTGLAGKIESGSLTGKERKFLVNHLKESRAAFLKSVKGLSDAQLEYRAGTDRWTIKECIQHIALSETNLRNFANAQLKQPANPEKRAEIKITDDALVAMMKDRSSKFQAPETFRPEQATWKTAAEAVQAFRDQRADLIRFAKTTTDDMRNHVAQAPFGWVDSYQMLLALSAHTLRHTAQIEEIKSSPGFPK